MQNKEICLGLNETKINKINFINFKDIIEKAINLGFDYIDTADSYYNGDLHNIIAKSISIPKKREKIKIINKFQLVKKNKLMSNLDLSLKKLKTDYIDVYMPHWPSLYFNPEDLCEQADKMINSGKIKYFGLSNFNLNLIKQFNKFFKKKIYLQFEINITNYHSIKNIINYSKKNNLKIFSYGINNFFPSNNLKISNEIKEKNINNYLFSLYWIKKFENIIPIIKTKKKNRLENNLHTLKNKINLKEKIEYYCNKNLKEINISNISKINSPNLFFYKNIQEAIQNKQKLFPSPKLIAEEIKKFNLAKPFFLKKISKNQYELISGQSRFWAYQIAYNNKNKVPAIVLD